MSRIKSPNCVDRMNAAERIGDTIKALEAAGFKRPEATNPNTSVVVNADQGARSGFSNFSCDQATGDLFENGIPVGVLITGRSGAWWRLIAQAQAAPEMFDALSKILAVMDIENWDSEKEPREQVRAILSKLT